MVVGWAGEAVGSKGGEVFFLFFSLKILKYLFGKGGVVTHQTAAGPPAGHVCLTTGSESSPLLA